MTTPILSELYMRMQEIHPEYLCQDTETTKQMETMIQGAIQKVFPGNEGIRMMNAIYNYANEYKDMGFISGFRICLRLIRELKQSECKGFMSEILIAPSDFQELVREWENPD